MEGRMQYTHTLRHRSHDWELRFRNSSGIRRRRRFAAATGSAMVRKVARSLSRELSETTGRQPQVKTRQDHCRAERARCSARRRNRTYGRGSIEPLLPNVSKQLWGCLEVLFLQPTKQVWRKRSWMGKCQDGASSFLDKA